MCLIFFFFFYFLSTRLYSWKGCSYCLVILEESESGLKVITAQSAKTSLVELLVLWENFAF